MYQIKAVDVYADGAKFLFAASPKGKEFSIELPGAFYAESVRIINHLDTEEVRIFTVKREKWIPSSLEGLKSKIDELTKANTVLQSRKAALAQTQKLLNEAAPPTRTNAEDIIAYIRMAQDMKLNAENELADIEASIRENQNAVSMLKAELDGRMPDCADEAIHITGRLVSGKVVVFEALTSCAGWTPKYTMDLNSKTGAIMTRLYARSSQKTGLDYTGQITFHTRTPDGDVSAPETIKPLNAKIKPKADERSSFDLYRPRESRMMASVKKPAPRAVMAEDEADIFPEIDISTALEQPKTAPAPRTKETLTDHSVKCSGTITGDGRDSELVLGDIELKGKIHLELIPEQRSDTWIIAEMEDAAKPLIPGQAVLRVDDQQTGTFFIPEYGLSRKTIPFGYVPGITAKKENTSKKTTSSLFNVSSGGYKITVTNDMQENQTVFVRDRDRIPVSKDKKVELEVKGITPEP